MGEKKSIDGDAISSLATDIISAIRSCDNGKSMDLKVLRSAVLTTTDIDKSSKKLFKSAVKLLEKDEKVSLSSEGVVKLSKSERRDGGNSDEKKDKKRSKRKSKENEADVVDDGDDKSMKKKQRTTEEDEELNADDSQQYEQNNDDDIEQNNDGNEDGGDNDSKHKNKPCKNNPQGITRLFLGNLPFAISEPTLNTHLEECITHVKWITDKATGKFYGSAFVEVRNSKDAAKAVTQINGTMLMGRPIKINFAPVRSGEENDWPPRSRVITGGKLANAGGGGGGSGGGQAGGSGIKAMNAKPDGCCKLFIGNLSYDIDDEGITKFFMGVEAELKAVRWLYHQDSGDFKGW
jgi:RNA recognition motif-containing protein